MYFYTTCNTSACSMPRKKIRAMRKAKRKKGKKRINRNVILKKQKLGQVA